MATAQEIANATGFTEAYGRMLLDGSRTPSLKAALEIFDATGDKFGPLAGLTNSEIKTARKMVKAEAA
jgi:hypothetical protein